MDAPAFQVRADIGCQLTQGHLRHSRHNGFPARRGRWRAATSRSCSSRG
jgi:hypothetical protein